MYARITFLVAMVDAKRSVTDITQSLAAAFQKFPDFAVKSVSSADHRQNNHVRRNDHVSDQFVVSRGFCTRNVHNLHKCWYISYLIYCGQAGVPQ